MNPVLRLKDLINYVSVKSSVIAIRFKVLLVKTFMNSIWHETQQFARIHVTVDSLGRCVMIIENAIS